MSWAIFGLVLFLPGGVRGTLTPNGVVALDCGGQQEFTCDVTGITTGNPATGWRINRLFNITAVGANGVTVANDNIRITTTTGGNVPTSTITITNFDMRDDGGTIQCVNTDDASIQGAATISVGTPSCPIVTAAARSIDFTNATVSWQQPSNTPVTSTTVTYCPTSLPNCGNSITCTSPCTISGLDPCMDYSFTVIPINNCGNTTGCTANSKNVTAQGLPICPTNFSANRDDDFTSATVTYQLATTPPVTSTTVTYCPTSSLNCGNSTTCTSPCTISGLDPCVEYNLSAIPTNNCGSPTGCDSMVVPAKGAPSCANISSLQNVIGDVCSVNLTWQQPDTPPVTSTTVTYCSTSSSCVNMTCTSPCIISGLDPGTEYQFTVTPNNNCGSPTGCTGNMDTVETRSDCVPESMLPVWVIIIIVIVVIILIVALTTAVVFIVICCCCAAVSAWLIATCCCCCKQANKNRNKPERFNRPPDEYADPKKVREKKEKEEKIQYAALEFSEQAGSSGEKPIRSKEEPVQYLSVEQA